MFGIKYFVYYLMAPIVLGFGLVGNITALVVFFNGELKKIGPVLIYKLMFIFDTLYIIQIIHFYLQFPFSLDLTILSRLSCKLWQYLSYQGDSITPIMLIYISLEKYTSIGNPLKSRMLNKRKNQIIYFLCVFAYCSAYAIVVPFGYDLIENIYETDSNRTNISSDFICNFVNYEMQVIITFIDTLNRLILPSILVLFFTFMLMLAVYRSRSRVSNSMQNQKRRRRDLRLAGNCFFMNIAFILLQTPTSVAYFLPNVFSEKIFFLSTLYIFFLSYGINFYVIFICNSLFRKEFFKIFNGKMDKEANKSTPRIKNNPEITIKESNDRSNK